MPLMAVPGILQRFDRERRQNILAKIKGETAQVARRVLRYPNGAAGTLANPAACTLPPDISVRKAIRRLRNHPDQVVDYIYVVNVESELLGYVRLHRFFPAPDSMIRSRRLWRRTWLRCRDPPCPKTF
jgi:Mg/Co/Ni transporter MgtE